MTLADFNIGDRIYVVWPKDGNRRVEERHEGSVINVGRKRLVIVLDEWPNRPRNITPEMVKKIE